MPYIPPKNRPAIDEAIEKLAIEMADNLVKNNITGSISENYRAAFAEICDYIVSFEKGLKQTASTSAQKVAESVIEMAKDYEQQGGWQGELNFAITRLIQWVPFEMYKRKEWAEALRYWLYAQTVGALVRTSYEIHDKYENDWVSNGLAGVFEDIKDEYKRRVNTAYERVQISKSGDCFEKSPFKTKLVDFEHSGVKGWIEIMLPQAELK